MKAGRWLLPFTSGMDMGAIDSLIHLAASAGATLVAVSLIAVPAGRRSRETRLEYIQQSKDFLEAVAWIAARYHVAIERHEVTTTNVVQQINLLFRELDCDCIALASRQGSEVLLRGQELKRLLEVPPARIVLIRIARKSHHHILGRLLSQARVWLHARIGLYDEANTRHNLPDSEETLWIRTELAPRK